MEGHRVKVYRLNEQGTWDDGGTGHVLVNTAQVTMFQSRVVTALACILASDADRFWRNESSYQLQKPIKILVRSESDQSELLYHEVRQDIAYQRQGGAQF